MFYLSENVEMNFFSQTISHTVKHNVQWPGTLEPSWKGYFPHSWDKNCERLLLTETNDALDQPGAVRHRVGPKHHSLQPKVVTHSFCPENVENNCFHILSQAKNVCDTFG